MRQNSPVERDPVTVLAKIREISETFALNRNEMQPRRALQCGAVALRRDAGAPRAPAGTRMREGGSGARKAERSC